MGSRRMRLPSPGATEIIYWRPRAAAGISSATGPYTWPTAHCTRLWWRNTGTGAGARAAPTSERAHAVRSAYAVQRPPVSELQVNATLMEWSMDREGTLPGTHEHAA